ncbi:MAG: queuosine precursor transporter [Candidatus Cryptobacteroides sp.]
MNNTESSKTRATVSVPFMLMSILFVVCLIASNLFETKLFTVCGIALTGGVIIFPVSYIINDCLVEVYGYRKSRMTIWMGFAMNFFVVAMAQIVRVLPEAPFWDGGEHFNYIFTMAPRVTIASLLAFVSGSTVNAWIMSRMKVVQKGKGFSFRAILSTIGGESVDSLIFFPIAFWGIGSAEMIRLMVTQIVLKTLYEIIILPLTNFFVRRLKKIENTDVYDENISYNPFKLKDM